MLIFYEKLSISEITSLKNFDLSTCIYHRYDSKYVLRKPEVWTEISSSKRQNRDMGAISKMDFIGQNRYLEAMSVEIES